MHSKILTRLDWEIFHNGVSEVWPVCDIIAGKCMFWFLNGPGAIVFAGVAMGGR